MNSLSATYLTLSLSPLVMDFTWKCIIWPKFYICWIWVFKKWWRGKFATILGTIVNLNIVRDTILRVFQFEFGKENRQFKPNIFELNFDETVHIRRIYIWKSRRQNDTIWFSMNPIANFWSIFHSVFNSFSWWHRVDCNTLFHKYNLWDPNIVLPHEVRVFSYRILNMKRALEM